MIDLVAADDSGASDSDNITSRASFTLTDEGEVGTKVVLFDGSSSKGTMTITAGSWSVKLSGLSQGLHSFTTKQLIDGVLGEASEPLEVSIDATAPASPAGLDLATESDVGFLSSDNITSAAEELLIRGRGEAGSQVTLFADRNKNGKLDSVEFQGIDSVVVGEDGSWEDRFEWLPDGTHVIVAIQTDVAGNVSKASSALTVVIDTTPPAVPTKLDLAAEDDSGSIATDNITSITNGLTINGSGESGLRVLLFEELDGELDTEPLAVAIVNNKGVWSADIPELTLGDHAIRAVQSDAAGGWSQPSEILAISVTEANLPPAPSAPVLLETDDTGSSNSDGITSKTSGLTITGSGEPNAKITLVREGASKTVGSAVVTATGSWSLKVANLTPGLHTLVAKQTIDGETSGESEPLSILIDASVPAAPSGLKINGSASYNQVLSSGTGLELTGSGANGAIVTLFDDINKDGKLATSELLATTTADESGAWSASVDLAGGSHAIRAVQTNLAGNISKATSTALAVTVTTPGGIDLAAEDDTGFSNSDNITNKSSGLTISGTTTTSKANAIRVLLFAGDATEALQTVAVSRGSWKTDLTLAAQADSWVLTAAQVYADGTKSGRSAPFTLKIDQEPPTAVADLTIVDGINLGHAGFITNKTAGLVITGTGGETGAQVILLENNKSIGSGLADSEGNWRVNVSKMSNGTHSITAKQADVAGNESEASEALMLSVDSVAPAAPTGLKFAAATGIVSGSGEKGATIILFNDSNKNSTVDTGEQIGEPILIDGNGKWVSPAVTDSLLAGRYPNVKAIQTDLAGNVSKSSNALSVTVASVSVAAASLTRVLNRYDGSALLGGTVSLFDPQHPLPYGGGLLVNSSG
ncbi:MAG: hypothetical protein HQL60_05885 [Magnetococcales bacterium]|nr:hypothetical protein [Magnetococcales bacterium]